MTPLQVYAELLAAEHDVAPPASASSHALQRWLNENTTSPREREIAWYLIDASIGGRLKRRGGYGTLKYVLWWLRDYAGELYPAAARGVLRCLLQRKDLPPGSSRVVDEIVPLVPEAASFRDLMSGAKGEILVDAHIELRRVGRWLLAINRTKLNLLSVVMKHTDADVYVASSIRGSVVKVRRGCDFPLAELVSRLGEDWVQPYPDLAICQVPADRWGADKIIKEVECLGNGNAASASCASGDTECGWTERPSAGSRWI